MEALLDRSYGHRIGANKHRKTAFQGMPDAYNIPMDALTAAGDVVSNLWGALDHLCYQLIDAYSPGCDPGVLERSAFPFAKDKSRYKETKNRRGVKFMDPGAVKIIDSLEPYPTGNSALSLLYELNNISKHRILLTVGTWVHMTADWIGEYSATPTFLLITSDPHFSGIYEPSEVHKHMQLFHAESLAKFDVGGGNAMLPTLHYLVDVVYRIINEFLPFLESQ